MKFLLSCSYSRPSLPLAGFIASFLTFLVLGSTIGCGGGAIGSGTGTTPSGNTAITLFTSGTANDQLMSFAVGLRTLTLTAQDGVTVNLLPSPIMPEFIHVNGSLEPFFTVSIPQGTYTSASATSSGGDATCDALDANGYATDRNTFAFVGAPAVTVSMPSPITVTGESMGLVLDSLVSYSASVPSDCSMTGTSSFAPSFVLTSLGFSAQQPTNSANGKVLEVQGVIASMDSAGAGFSVSSIYDDNIWRVASNARTTYQGVSGPSQFAAGMPVDMDLAVQQDGSLLATRVAVYDTNPVNLTLGIGPIVTTNTVDWAWGVETESLLGIGYGAAGGSVPGYTPDWTYNRAVFQVSGQLTNLGSLPFSASFVAANMVAGQHVFATTHDSIHEIDGVNGYSNATTLTLVPQTLNGTVDAISSESGFTTYTITLAPYDFFPQFAAQPNQVSVLTDPRSIVVYADSNTAMLNTHPIAVGGVARFYGLVFNDGGTLRMDCAQINDGVAE